MSIRKAYFSILFFLNIKSNKWFSKHDIIYSLKRKINIESTFVYISIFIVCLFILFIIMYDEYFSLLFSKIKFLL